MFSVSKCARHLSKQNEVTELGEDYYRWIQAGDTPPHVDQFIQNFGPVHGPLNGFGEGDSVVEIGPGRSNYIAMFESKGLKYSAIEPSVWACDWIRKNHQDSTVHCCRFEDYSSDEKFSVVFSAHSLEHFHDAPAAIRKMRSIVKPDGLVYILIPDMSDLANADHYWFFTQASLSKMLIECGLRPLHAKTVRIVKKERFIYCVARPV